MNELVTVRNTLNGGVARVRRNIADHPVFGKHLEIVPDGTKPNISLKVLVDSKRPKPAPPVVAFDLEEDDE